MTKEQERQRFARAWKSITELLGYPDHIEINGSDYTDYNHLLLVYNKGYKQDLWLVILQDEKITITPYLPF